MPLNFNFQVEPGDVQQGVRTGTDYRLPPLQARNETYNWTVPEGLEAGPVTVTATVWYSKLVPSVASYLGVPAEEATPIKLAQHQTTFIVVEP